MDRALWLLLALRLNGWARRFGRSLTSIKGIGLTLIGLIIFLPYLGAMLFSVHEPGQDMRVEATRHTGPLMLLLYSVLTLLLSSGERAIYFAPAEVNLLFSGPFSRRQLLAYKIAAAAGMCLLSALFMAVFLGRHAAWSVAAYVGLVLALMFMQLFAMAVALINASVGEAANTWRRRLVLLGLVAVAGLALAGIGREALALSPQELLRRVEQSPAMQAVLTPFRWFILAFTADRLWPDLIQWAGLGLLVNLALVALVMALDAQYLETAASASARIYARIEQVRRGNVGGGGIGWGRRARLGPGAARPPRFSLPMPPWWGGIGPIAWRQLTSATRDFSRPLVLLVCFGVMTGVGLFVGGGESAPREATQSFAFFVPMLTLMLTQSVTFDFRADVDRIDVLKTLPMSGSRLAVGQLVTPVLVLSAVQWAALAILALGAGPREATGWMGAVAAFVPPFNVLLFGLENLMFLWFPVRLTSTNPADIQNMGRVILMMFAKVTLLAIAGGISAGLGFAAYFASGQNGLAALSAAWLALSALALAIIPVIAAAFRRFDVARDTPA